jgi:hypothetical protein
MGLEEIEEGGPAPEAGDPKLLQVIHECLQAVWSLEALTEEP